MSGDHQGAPSRLTKKKAPPGIHPSRRDPVALIWATAVKQKANPAHQFTTAFKAVKLFLLLFLTQYLVMSVKIKFRMLKEGESPDWRLGDQVDSTVSRWISDGMYDGSIPIPKNCKRKFRRPIVPDGYKLPKPDRIHLLYKGYWLPECLPH